MARRKQVGSVLGLNEDEKGQPIPGEDEPPAPWWLYVLAFLFPLPIVRHPWWLWIITSAACCILFRALWPRDE